MKNIAVIAVILLLVGSLANAQDRVWKLPQGETRATLVVANSDVAIFMSPNSRQFRIQREALGKTDNEIVREFCQRREKLKTAHRHYTNDPTIKIVEGVNKAEMPYAPKTHFALPTVAGKLNGVGQWRAENGKLVYVEQYKDGEIVDEKVQYYPDGEPYAVFFYSNGKAHGRSLVLYKNGTVARAIDFKNGEPTGLYVSYYPNGQIRDIYNQVGGENQGRSKHYLPNGRLFGEQTWILGQLEDKRIVFELNRFEYEQSLRYGVKDLGRIWE